MFSTVYEIPWTLNGVIQTNKIGLRMEVEDIDDRSVLNVEIESIAEIGDVVLKLDKEKVVEIVMALAGETRNLP